MKFTQELVSGHAGPPGELFESQLLVEVLLHVLRGVGETRMDDRDAAREVDGHGAGAVRVPYPSGAALAAYVSPAWFKRGQRREHLPLGLARALVKRGQRRERM